MPSFPCIGKLRAYEWDIIQSGFDIAVLINILSQIFPQHKILKSFNYYYVQDFLEKNKEFAKQVEEDNEAKKEEELEQKPSKCPALVNIFRKKLRTSTR